MSDGVEKSRRRLQFTIRSLAIGTLVIAGYLGGKVPAEKRAQLAQEELAVAKRRLSQVELIVKHQRAELSAVREQLRYFEAIEKAMKIDQLEHDRVIWDHTEATPEE